MWAASMRGTKREPQNQRDVTSSWDADPRAAFLGSAHGTQGALGAL